jgi:hypothetical protein
LGLEQIGVVLSVERLIVNVNQADVNDNGVDDATGRAVGLDPGSWLAGKHWDSVHTGQPVVMDAQADAVSVQRTRTTGVRRQGFAHGGLL